MSTESPALVVPPGTDPNADETEVKDDKALDELLDFIEGNQKSSNEKKRAKKERQKMQKISEIKKKEDEERRIREAEEAERKRWILFYFFEKITKNQLKLQWYFVNKIVLTYCEKKLFKWSRKTFEIRGGRPRISKFLRSLEQFIQTVKGQNNFW